MNKIAAVLDIKNVNLQVLDCACFLSKASNSRLHIVFLGNDNKAVSQVITDHVRNTCIQRECDCILEPSHMLDPEELLTYCLFIDLLILDPSLSGSRGPEAVPTTMATFILHHAPCPVIISSDIFEGVQELIFPYTSSSNALFALKQFTYLLPAFDAVKLTLLEILATGEHSTYDTQLMEWMNGYYAEVQQVTRRGHPAAELLSFLLPRKNALVIMGSFGGSFLKHMTHQSTSVLSARYTSNTFFIAHR